MRETFQNILFVAFKRNKNLEESSEGHTIKIEKVFKTDLENRKRKSEPSNIYKLSNYAVSRSLTLVHSEVTKHRNYTLHFTRKTVKASLSFT